MPEGTRDETGGANSTPPLFRNMISLVGGALAVISAANILFLILVEYISARPSPYIGVFAYMILPGVLVFGLVLVPVGILWERHHRRRREPSIPKFPRIDLNDPRQRSAFAMFLTFTIVFVALSAVGSYRAYEFTDSVQFCGQLCHTVMNPEYTAYSLSPHARVRCVDCHVGPGAGWYVRSKLSGAYQVYAVLFHKYPKPIPTPVENLRPAQQTCEQCHWPRKFYGAQLKVFHLYGSDEHNTPREIRMLINVGGANPAEGSPSGIHWHMNIANKIEYIARDKQRQDIPWVQVTDQQGRVTVYQSKDNPLTAQQIATMPRRRMDCVDCHNRPTHIYVPPDQSVDEALLTHRMDSSLPYIKAQAVQALVGNYNTTPEAMEGIANSLDHFYEQKYPDVFKTRRTEVQAAITEVQRIYRYSFFPEMKVDWRTHPNNIGHFISAGCFRCHDDNHVSADGRVVPKKCDTCHTILSENPGTGEVAGSAEGIQFKHPVDIGDITQMNCADCHTGGVAP